jgi:predicted acyltransferase
MSDASIPSRPSTPTRVASIDAYRGFVMLLMMAEVLHLGRMAKALPDSELWRFLAHHQSHVAWGGCSLHDLIQPSFSFLVGVALPFSIASRRARGESPWRSGLHAVWRAALLIVLGIFLRSVGRPRTNFTFEDTLTQIGLGYVFLFALGHVRAVWQWAALGVILVGYWAAFALYPLPGPEFAYRSVSDLTEAERPTGFAAHWDKNTNPAWDFDVWFLNQFPREKPFTHNDGGYATLSFIPTLGTMILGLIAGGWMRSSATRWANVARFVLLGLVLLAAGWGLDVTGACPSVKRIWTPSWVLFSGGWCFLLLTRLVGIPAQGDRRQLDRRLRRVTPRRAVRSRLVQDPFRRGRLLAIRAVRAAGQRPDRARRLLARPVLDVPAEDIREDLKTRCTVELIG